MDTVPYFAKADNKHTLKVMTFAYYLVPDFYGCHNVPQTEFFRYVYALQYHKNILYNIDTASILFPFVK